MAYVRRHWVDYPRTETPIDADALNNIEDGIEESHNIQLLAVTDTAPSECAEGDKYYDTTTKLIYTATGTDEWGETGETPIANIFYFVLDEQTGYTYNGSTLVSIGGESMPSILSTIYPVGSIYMSVNSTNPSVLFGGTWEQLEDRFLLGASSTYSAGSTGGGATTGSASGDTGSTTLTINQMPAHTHRPSLYDAGLKTLVGGLNWTNPTSKLSGYWGTGTTETGGYIERVGGGKGHTHTLNNHTHTQALPPYLAVYMWKRTA